MKRFGLSLGLAFATLGVLAMSASASTIVVNSNSDAAPDANDGSCTLQEAIIAANTDTQSGFTAGECAAGNDDNDTINFNNPPFTGMVATTIVSTNGMPDITENLTIDAGTVGAIQKPRVGLRVTNPGTQGLAITGGAVTVDGLAITGATTGIDARGGTLIARDVWIGLSLDQNVVLGNNIGIQLGSNSTVGSLTADQPNVFAGNLIGIQTAGGDNNTIIRNYFGSKTDGTTSVTSGAIENGIDIHIVDNTVGPNPATNNLIGGADSGDPNICDTTCNLISNATGDGIALVGGGGDPATGPTTISGN